GLAEQRIVHGRIDPCEPARRLRLAWESEPGAEIELLRLPWAEALAKLPGIPGRVAGKLHRFPREERGGLMVLTSAGPGRRERDDHVRPDHPDEPHEVAGNLVAAPFLQRFLYAVRVAEIDGSAE